MEGIFAVYSQLDIGELALSIIVEFTLTWPRESAVFVDILHLSLAGIAIDQVVILDVLGLLGEDKVVIDRGLHHVLVDLLDIVFSSIIERVEGEGLRFALINMEENIGARTACRGKRANLYLLLLLSFAGIVIKLKDSDHAIVVISIRSDLRREKKLASSVD